MNNDKLTLGSIIGVGVLASSLVIGTEAPTAATLIEPTLNMNSESVHKMAAEDYPNYLKENFLFSFLYDQITIGSDSYADEPPEIEVIEVPVVKKMVFQFKKPIKMEFS
jgi:hypothetical protein